MPPSPTPSPIPTPTTEPQTIESDIVNFSLENLTIPLGTTIIWTNRDGATHTSTSGHMGTATDAWDSPVLSQNVSFSFTFDEAGTFQYFCRIHPTIMNSSITVTVSEP